MSDYGIIRVLPAYDDDPVRESERSTIRAKLANRSPGVRDIVKCHCAGMSVSEITHLTGCPEYEVRSHITRWWKDTDYIDERPDLWRPMSG